METREGNQVHSDLIQIHIQGTFKSGCSVEWIISIPPISHISACRCLWEVPQASSSANKKICSFKVTLWLMAKFFESEWNETVPFCTHSPSETKQEVGHDIACS